MELPPGGGAWFEPWDLGQTDGTVYTMFLCGGLLVTWVPSLSAGAEDYAVYGGNLGTWYGHTPVTCTDAASDLQEDFTPATGDRYYLVVALNPNAEGSYGRRPGPVRRPLHPASPRFLARVGMSNVTRSGVIRAVS